MMCRMTGMNHVSHCICSLCVCVCVRWWWWWWCRYHIYRIRHYFFSVVRGRSIYHTYPAFFLSTPGRTRTMTINNNIATNINNSVTLQHYIIFFSRNIKKRSNMHFGGQNVPCSEITPPGFERKRNNYRRDNG